MRLFAPTLFSLVVLSSSALAQETILLQTQPGATKINDAASYGIGYEIGRNVASGGMTVADFNQNDFLAGLLDAIGGKDPQLTPETVRAAMEALGKKVLARKKAIAKQFMEENKKKDGVQTTKSGLQYKVIKSGNGASPTAASTVTVHYEGKLLSGSIFDSSLQNGQPVSFAVNRVIPGWTEALLRMKVGDKWQLFIPPELAYGERGSPPVIGPNEALIFEVELLEVK